MRRPMKVTRTIRAAAFATCVLLAGCSSEPRTPSVPAEANAAPVAETKPSATPLATTEAEGVRVPVEERTTPQGFSSEAGTAARSADLSEGALSPQTVPSAPMGTEPGKSVLDGVDSPDRVVDREADSVRRGRRLVDPIDEELGSNVSSAEALATKILSAIRADDSQALHALLVSEREFARIFWPEFPQSRPATNLKAEDAWFFHNGSCHDGVSEIVSAFGGQELRLDRVRATKGRLDFANFDLYDGIVIDAVDANGASVSVPWAITFAERNGRWKVYMYKA